MGVMFISTSLPSASRNPMRRSRVKPLTRPRMMEETLAWSVPIRDAASVWVILSFPMVNVISAAMSILARSVNESSMPISRYTSPQLGLTTIFLVAVISLYPSPLFRTSVCSLPRPVLIYLLWGLFHALVRKFLTWTFSWNHEAQRVRILVLLFKQRGMCHHDDLRWPPKLQLRQNQITALHEGFYRPFALAPVQSPCHAGPISERRSNLPYSIKSNAALSYTYTMPYLAYCNGVFKKSWGYFYSEYLCFCNAALLGVDKFSSNNFWPQTYCWEARLLSGFESWISHQAAWLSPITSSRREQKAL